jgi:phosphopantetheinyl transferase (holo-ACP synthase)
MLSIVRFDTDSLESLKQRARPVLGRSGFDDSGKVFSRRLTFYAGRAAVADLLAHQGKKATVKPEENFGYLQLFDSQGIAVPDLFVNISHTVDIAVAVLGSAPIGVDVESIHRSAERVLIRVASQEELGRSHESWVVEGGTIPSGISLWSAKEAVSKAVGLGIKFGMRDFQIGKPEGALYPVQIRQKGPMALTDPVVRFLRYEDWVISVCSERQVLTAGIAILNR